MVSKKYMSVGQCSAALDLLTNFKIGKKSSKISL